MSGIEYNGMLGASTLIKEVEKRPALYDPKAANYTDKVAKSRMWEEIARIVIAEFDSFDERGKENALKELIKKWRNIRDSFTKEVKMELRTPQHQRKTKRRYIYYHLLQFLLPCTLGLDYEDTTKGLKKEIKSEEVHAIPFEVEDDMTEASTAGPSSNDGDCDDLQGNHSFLLSFVPVMNSLSPELAMEARFQITKMFRNLQRTNQFVSDSNYSSAHMPICDIKVLSPKSTCGSEYSSDN